MKPVHTLLIDFSKLILILYSPLRLVIPSGLFPSGFPAKILYEFLTYPMHATCPVHLFFFKLWRSPLCQACTSKDLYCIRHSRTYTHISYWRRSV